MNTSNILFISLINDRTRNMASPVFMGTLIKGCYNKITRRVMKLVNVHWGNKL